MIFYELWKKNFKQVNVYYLFRLCEEFFHNFIDPLRLLLLDPVRDPGQELQLVILDVLCRVLRGPGSQVLVSGAEYLESPHTNVPDLLPSLRVSPELDCFLCERPSVKINTACPLTTVPEE